MLLNTNFPLIVSSQAVNSCLFSTSGIKTISPVIPSSEVEGLYANCLPESVLILGEVISICVIPLSHPAHSPNSCSSAFIPQPVYFFIAQSIPLFLNPILLIQPLYSLEYRSVFKICKNSPALGSSVKLPTIDLNFVFDWQG